MIRRILCAAGLAVILAAAPGSVPAGVTTEVARVAADEAARVLGRSAERAAVTTLSRRLERLAATHGADALVAVRRAGPEAVERIERAGSHGALASRLLAEHGPEAIPVVREPALLPRQRRSSCRSDNPVRQAGGVGQDCPTYFLAGVILELVARHGDDAARALMRHPGLAQSVIASCGAPGARALAGLSPRQARRLAMLIDDGTLSRLGRSQEVLQVIEKYGDRGLNFLWDHKGALAVGTILTAFLADPAAFLDGTKKLGGEAAGLVTKPAWK